MFIGTLYDIQKPAAEFLCNKRRALLAFEQGLGKTVIGLAACEKLFEFEKATNVLVLAPTSLAWQWTEKIMEFTDTPWNYAQAKKKDSRTYIPLDKPNYWVVPYSLLRKDYELIVRQKWDVVIADEVQEFKNMNTKGARYAKKLNVKSKPTYRWGFTGTAISTKLEELYSIFYWIDPKFLPPWPVFQDTHIVRNELGIIERYKNLEALNKYLQQRMDRKTHADSKGHIPRILEQTVRVPTSKEYVEAQHKLLPLLDKMAQDVTFDSEGNLQVPKNSELGKVFTAARRGLVAGSKVSHTVEICRRILEENALNRVVIFSFYKEPLYRLREELPEDAVLFTGDQTIDERRSNIQRFQEGTRVLLASNAGATGLDLPFANYVIHLDIPFSFATLDQRTKRITRMSSKFDHVVCIYMIMDDSFEIFYYQAVKQLEKLSKAAQEGGEDEVIVRPSSLRSHIRGDDDDGRTVTTKATVLSRPKKSTNPYKPKTRASKARNKGHAAS